MKFADIPQILNLKRVVDEKKSSPKNFSNRKKFVSLPTKASQNISIMSPEFVKNNGVIADNSYIEWLSDVKRRFKSSQIKAAVRVNTEMLSFYWSIGRDIVALKAESKWGSGFFNQLSLDLKTAFPDETGFSYTN